MVCFATGPGPLSARLPHLSRLLPPWPHTADAIRATVLAAETYSNMGRCVGRRLRRRSQGPPFFVSSAKANHAVFA